MAALWWIRRDLRLEDNLTLQKALENPPILPVFILDPILLKGAPKPRLDFLFKNLHKLEEDLLARGSYLVIRKGAPVVVLEKLLRETRADLIIAEEDFTPYDRLRSVLVGGCLPLKLVQGQLGIHPLAGLKANGKPYTVYTPFLKNWLAHQPALGLISAPGVIPTIIDIPTDPIPLVKDKSLFLAGEVEAQKKLADFLSTKIQNYHNTRDRMDISGTSQLSPYIHFGIIGLRTAIYHAQRLLSEITDGSSSRGWKPG